MRLRGSRGWWLVSRRRSLGSGLLWSRHLWRRGSGRWLTGSGLGRRLLSCGRRLPGFRHGCNGSHASTCPAGWLAAAGVECSRIADRPADSTRRDQDQQFVIGERIVPHAK